MLGLCTFVNVFIFKIVLGSFDVGTDVASGYNLLSGQFALGLYFSSKTRELYNQAPDHTIWGCLSLALVWLPGLVRISILAASRMWKNMGAKNIEPTCQICLAFYHMATIFHPNVSKSRLKPFVKELLRCKRVPPQILLLKHLLMYTIT